MKNIKVEWCKNYIRSQFSAKHHPFWDKPDAGIEIGCFFGMAAKAGLYTPNTYGTPMSDALEELCDVIPVTDKDGNWYYSVFRLKPEYKPAK